MKKTFLIVALFSVSCSVYKGADGSMAGDFGRDAGVVMVKGSDGSMYVVVDQNESKSFGKLISAFLAKFTMDTSIGLAKETTAQQSIEATKAVQLGAQTAGVETAKTQADLIKNVGAPGEVPIKPINSP